MAPGLERDFIKSGSAMFYFAPNHAMLTPLGLGLGRAVWLNSNNAMLVLGMMLRLSNSLFMQWRGTSDAQTMSPQPISNPPCPKTTTARHSA